MDDLIISLKERHTVVLMPRGERQEEHYRQPQFQGITIPAEPLTLEDLAFRCALFIGAGGTMTREAAVLGIPTISVYQGELLAVDRYLLT
jgi:predicted glycosyltransferase